MNSDVSVIIAAKNYGHYLPLAIESALQQSLPALEIIVLDDGSTDDTPQIIKNYCGSHSLIKGVRLDGLGLSRARNIGIELSKGRFVALLDADDLWEPEKLHKQMPLFENSEVGVVYSRRTLIDPQGVSMPPENAVMFRGNLFNTFVRTNPVCSSSVVIRREVLDHVGIFDPKVPMAVDYDLWLRVSPFYQFDYVDEPLVKYRTGHANMSSRLSDRVEVIIHLLEKTLNRKDLPVKPDPEAVAEGWGSTCRSMAYAIRRRNRIAAAKWYLKAATYDGHWFRSFKSMAGVFLKG